MSHFCKTCRYLKRDRERRIANCMFWVEFAKAFPMPFGRIAGPNFQSMVILARHVWDDLPTPDDLAALGRDFTSEPWSEVMDCSQWQPEQNAILRTNAASPHPEA